MALVVGVIGGVVGATTGVYLEERHSLKKGDLDILNEANREREAERLNGGPPKLTHCLHSYHQLVFVYGTTSFRCEACLQSGSGNRYRCDHCNFDLHEACAVSDEVYASLQEEQTILKPIVHEHPLTLVTGSSLFTCRYCNNKSRAQYRYYCAPCKKSFDTMCATHPTRLSFFAHPQHELELKTKHHFKKCVVCNHGGKSNARVFSCEQCECYVHPKCAVGKQYLQHPLHSDHTLVVRQDPSDGSIFCTVCRQRCSDGWYYGCSVCKDVDFHHECLYPPEEPSVTRKDSRKNKGKAAVGS